MLQSKIDFSVLLRIMYFRVDYGFQQHLVLIVLFTSIHAGVCAVAQESQELLGLTDQYSILRMGCAQLLVCCAVHEYHRFLLGSGAL